MSDTSAAFVRTEPVPPSPPPSPWAAAQEGGEPFSESTGGEGDAAGTTEGNTGTNGSGGEGGGTSMDCVR